jgi:hypothetical protein
VKRTVAALGLECEQVPRRLIRSIVDDHKLTSRVSLRIKRRKASFEERWTVPRYDDCGYSYHEGTPLTYESFKIILQWFRFFLRWPQVEAGTNHVTAHFVKHDALYAA